MINFIKGLAVQLAVTSGFIAVDQAVRTVVAQKIKSRMESKTHNH